MAGGRRDVHGYFMFIAPPSLRTTDLALRLALADDLTEEEQEEASFLLGGSWGQYSAHGVLNLPSSLVDPTVTGVGFSFHEYAFGDLYYGFPTALGNESGTATWRGGWSGQGSPWDRSRNNFASSGISYVLGGDATVVYDFAERDVDVALSIGSSDSLDGSRYPGPDLFREDIPQHHDGSFLLQGNHKENTPLELEESGYIDGDFYGPNAEEAAGIFDGSREDIFCRDRSVARG